MTSLKDRILKERGLTQVRTKKPGKKRATQVDLKPTMPVDEKLKTTHMKYLEQKYRVKMEQVLVSGSLRDVAKKLGNEVDATTISKWIKRLQLRYTEDNLPECEDCRHYEPICDGGVCPLLMRLEHYDLALVKYNRINGGTT